MLSDREQSYYAELFQSCDVDGTGKFSSGQVADLFRASGLPQEVLMQITELCGAKRLGHFGRSQFYIALKLIAAAQCGLPVSHESINSGVDIPLPKFLRVLQPDAGAPVADNILAAERLQHKGQLPPPPTSKKSHGRNLSGQFQVLQPEQAPLQIPPTQPPVADTKHPPFTPGQATMPSHPPLAVPQSPPTVVPTSPIGPNISASTAVTNSHPAKALKGSVGKSTIPLKETDEWAKFESDDEKHGLLGHVRKEGWDGLKLPDVDSSSYSSDTESVEDVWSINDEQREYYVNQFQTIEPDLNGHISGVVAKEFFEKSKLSNHELSKIWNLSDLNRDGALSLEEFCIAMHLVVLRRNEIEIPDRLPFALMPYNAFTNEDQEPFAADLPEGSTLKRLSPMSPPESQLWGQATIQESPGISSSEVSSPGVTPANFDFPNPETDVEAHIVHPKARRMSPDMMENEEIREVRPERGRAFSEPVPMLGEGTVVTEPGHVMVTKQRSNTTYLAETNNIDASSSASFQGRPRPLVKKNTVPGAMPGHIRPPVPLSSQHDYDASQEPPAPPPRPGPHNRSMSVDYKAPPAVPPRITAKEPPGSAKKISQFEPIQSQEVLNIIPGSNATTTVGPIDTERYRRTHSLDYGQAGDHRTDAEHKTAVAWDLLGEDFNDGSAQRQNEFALAAQRQASRDKKDLQMAIRTHKERNSTLSRLNSELNQELQEVMEQRIALEIQLEHLRPFSS